MRRQQGDVHAETDLVVLAAHNTGGSRLHAPNGSLKLGTIKTILEPPQRATHSRIAEHT